MTTPNSKGPPKPSYVSSSGNVLEQYSFTSSTLSVIKLTPFRPPLTARLSRAADDIYNFFGLYLVSLFSLDPYTAAQNSQFNTRGRPNSYQDRARWGGVNRTGAGGGGGGGTGGSIPRGGGGGGGSGSGSGSGSGRRMGTVDDVRGPECGSCG